MSRILPLQIPCFYDRRRNNSNWGGFSWSDVGCHTAGRAIENDVVQWQDMSVESAWYPGSFAESLHWPRLSVVTHLGCVWYHVDLQLNLAFVLCVFLCSGIFCCGCVFAFCFVWFSYSIISQKIGLEERLRNDLYYVRWFSLYFYVFRVSLDHFGFVFSNFILLGLVFRYWAKKLAGKNVSEMTYFVSSGA